MEKTILKQCKCGGKPERIKKKTRYGMRWWIRCTECHKRTKKHKPNGRDIYEWNQSQSY